MSWKIIWESDRLDTSKTHKMSYKHLGKIKSDKTSENYLQPFTELVPCNKATNSALFLHELLICCLSGMQGNLATESHEFDSSFRTSSHKNPPLQFWWCQHKQKMMEQSVWLANGIVAKKSFDISSNWELWQLTEMTFRARHKIENASNGKA